MSGIPEFDPDGPELIYVAVADHVQARIEVGELRPGSRMTPERELADEYGVSYGTIRRAMQELRDRGMIRTVHGKGTFVVPPETRPAPEQPAHDERND